MPKGYPTAGVRRSRATGEVITSKRTTTEQIRSPESRFTINERFGFVTDMVSMLARGQQPSIIITGPGGLGKSHTVIQALKTHGLRDVTLLDDEEIPTVAPNQSFCVVKGFSSAKGLYRTLYENRHSVLVFDDCDSVLKDPMSLNLLKGALDSYARRIISWRADIRDDDLPTTFEFNGRVVFISNMMVTQLDQAIVTRSMAVDLTMTQAQKVERMVHIVNQQNFLPEYSLTYKLDALRLIDQLRNTVKELSLRTLIQVTKIRSAHNDNWENLAEYAICG
jgi:hypothetical protein